MPKKTLMVTLCAIAASLTAAVSCVENDRSLGSGLLPDESILTLGTKTFDLPVTNRVSPSVQAANSIKMMVGTMTDPVFGTVESCAATYIIPYSSSTDFGDDPKLLSAYINLSIDSTYYLENDQKGIHQRIKIYRLLTSLDSTDMAFCNSLTSEDFSLEPITVSDPVIYGEGVIRIELKDEFAQELLDTTPEEFEDISQFLKRIPGLYIQTEPSMGTVGGRMNFLSLGNSTINLNYTLNDSERGITDLDTTESFAFGYSGYEAFNYFSTGSEGLSNKTPGEELYIESLSGIKPHIAAADLKEMLDNWIQEEGLEGQTIAVSRAELKFPYEEPVDYGRFDMEHPPYIYAFTRVPTSDNDSLYYYQPLSEVYNTSNYGSINRSLLEYSMDITAYVQNIINTDSSEIDEDQDLWIAPMKYKVNISDTRVYEFDNYNYNKTVLNGPAAERRPTLTITYGLMQ